MHKNLRLNENKILINCINSHDYGGFTYWLNFLKNFKTHTRKSKNIFYFIINENSKISKYVNQKNTIIVKNYIHKNILLRFLYEQIYIPLFIFKKYNFKIFFNGKNIAPILIRKKSIIVIRNIEPFFYYRKKLSINKFITFLKFILTIVSLRDCYKIISVSENTKKIIRKYSSKKILVIPNGISVSTKYKNKWAINKFKNYILNVSKFIPYANQLKLLKIYKECSLQDKNLPPLYFAGSIHDKKYFNQILQFISNNKLKNKIKFLGYLSRNRLHNMIMKCKLFIFSSELESCPQTILEARSIGCPILSSNIEPMPEFLKKDAYYFDINNINETKNKLLSIIKKINKKKILRKKFLLNKFSWRNVVFKYFKVFVSYEK
jgi:glycosyltransferase involved in cell wall biosynthesis